MKKISCAIISTVLVFNLLSFCNVKSCEGKPNPKPVTNQTQKKDKPKNKKSHQEQHKKVGHGGHPPNKHKRLRPSRYSK